MITVFCESSVSNVFYLLHAQNKPLDLMPKFKYEHNTFLKF